MWCVWCVVCAVVWRGAVWSGCELSCAVAALWRSVLLRCCVAAAAAAAAEPVPVLELERVLVPMPAADVHAAVAARAGVLHGAAVVWCGEA